MKVIEVADSDGGLWFEALKCISCCWIWSFEIPKSLLKVMHWSVLLPGENAVPWHDHQNISCCFFVFLFFHLLFPSSYVNNTWTIQGKKWEDGCSDWVRKAVLLSSSCCSACTRTAGTYITVRLPALTLFPFVSLPLPCLLTYWSVYAFMNVSTWPPYLYLTHTLIQMSNQHLCLWAEFE